MTPANFFDGKIAVLDNPLMYIFYSEEKDLWIEIPRDACTFVGNTVELYKRRNP